MNVNATLFVELVLFFLFWWAVRYFVWDHLISFLDQRQALIDQGIREAAQAKSALEEVGRLKAEAELKAKEDARSILDEAREVAKGIVAEAKEAARTLQKATEESLVEAEKRAKKEALDGVSDGLVDMCVALTQRLVSDKIVGSKTKQRALLTQYVSERDEHGT
ncbi:MAG: hypothetical protein VXY77_03155 [Pseudomonadota bacterium]|nr:hypothetical protein [Pseudomonadota bacterium]MEC8461185.1 hypothetical protein [Pseudomonadota bacterium]